ncbi:MAG: hypothetical protein AAFW64_00765 [Pseudomonadota bacterium]
MPQKIYLMVPDTAPFDPNQTHPSAAETLRDHLAQTVGAHLVDAGYGTRTGTAKMTGQFGAENGHARHVTIVGDDPMAEAMVRQMLASPHGAALGSFAVAAVFDTPDALVAEGLIWDAAHAAGLQDAFALHVGTGVAGTEADAALGGTKSIEIYYDTDTLPNGFADPLDFREAACAVIETALLDAGAGDWAGAECGAGEVNFGFEVSDFERAEKIVRAAVKGTPFEDIREITRFSDAGPLAAE